MHEKIASVQGRDLVCCGKCQHFVKIRLKPRQKSTKKVYRYLQERRNLKMGRYRLNLLKKHLRNSNILSIKCSKCNWRRMMLGQTMEMHEQQKVYLSALEVRPLETSFQSPATTSKLSDSKKRKFTMKLRSNKRWEEMHSIKNDANLVNTIASSQSNVLDKRQDISFDSSGVGPSVSALHCGSQSITQAKASAAVQVPIATTSVFTLSVTNRVQATAKPLESHPRVSTPASREKRGQFHQQLQLMLQKETARNTGKQSLTKFLQSLQHI